jgi:hypothetical protein
MKIKVVAFMLVLLLFTGALTYLEIKRFGSLTGFISRGQSTLSAADSTNIDSVVFGELIFIVLIFFIITIIFRFIFNHYSNKFNESIDSQVIVSKKLIPLDLGHSEEE